jgi:tetrahydromethanopterin S-methyltransferase subunit G
MDSSDFGKMIGDGIGALFNALVFAVILLIIFVPLGVWKLVEIIIWLYRHFS